MPSVADIARFLEEFAPLRLAEDWDNVGLLLGERDREVKAVMTCLTVTPDSAAEAVAEEAGLIVAHHPLPFRSLKRITSDTPEGRLLWTLIGAGVSLYSPHTAFDSAKSGINQRLAEGLKLDNVQPLTPVEGDPEGLGAGRFGELAQPVSLSDLAGRLKEFLGIDRLRLVGDARRVVGNAAVACGSAGEFLSVAQRHGCDCLITGETSFHTCLAAEALDVALLLTGHYASERFAVEQLADVLAQEFPRLKVWASREERDPLRWV